MYIYICGSTNAQIRYVFNPAGNTRIKVFTELREPNMAAILCSFPTYQTVAIAATMCLPALGNTRNCVFFANAKYIATQTYTFPILVIANLLGIRCGNYPLWRPGQPHSLRKSKLSLS